MTSLSNYSAATFKSGSLVSLKESIGVVEEIVLECSKGHSRVGVRGKVPQQIGLAVCQPHLALHDERLRWLIK